MRAPDACIRQAAQVGPAVGQFVTVLFSGTFPWARLRQAQKLLRLAERYGAARVNAACARALAFDLLDVRRVEEIVRTALEREPPAPRARHRRPTPGPLRPPAAELCPSPRSPERRTDRWRSPRTWSAASSACAWAACSPPCPTAPPTPARPNSVPSSFSSSCSRTRSIAATARASSRGWRPPASRRSSPPEAISWDTPVSYDRPRVRELFGLHWLAQQENVIFSGPVGVGKSFFAQALGHSACRAGHHVRYIKVAKLLLALHPSRADNSFERELRSWLAPDLLILDDFGLRKLTAQQSSDFYDVLVERDRQAATILTSNRAVDEWVALFDDPILANSALDRFAHRAHQIVMEGPSLRAPRTLRQLKGERRPGKRPLRGDSQIWVASSNALLEALRPSVSAAPPPKAVSSTACGART